MDSNFHNQVANILQDLEQLKKNNDLNATTVACIVARLCHLCATVDQSYATKYFGNSIQSVKKFCPTLSWMEIMKELNFEGEKKLIMLMDVFHSEKCKVAELCSPWTNLKSQFNLIEQILKNPEVIRVLHNEFQLVSINALKKQPEHEDIAPWIYLDLFDLLMHFADQGLENQVEDIIKVPVEKCPDVLVLALIQSEQPVLSFRKELLFKLIPSFLDGRDNSGEILSLILNQEDETIKTIFVASIAKWSMEGKNLRSRLSRILDVSPDINLRYSAQLSSENLIEFSIDVAFVASRRDYFKFEEWLSGQIENKKEKLVSALHKFLRRHTTPGPTGEMYGATAMKLPHDALLTLLVFLNSQVEHVDECTKTKMEECISLIKKSILYLPVPMRPNLPEPKKPRLNVEREKIMDESTNDFALISCLPGYVDKSLLIQSIMNDSSAVLLQAPRRFGKSTNLNMLMRFFEMHNNPAVTEENRSLFRDLKIACHESTFENGFGRYPVIHLDFKTSKVIRTSKDAYDVIHAAISRSYKRHIYLLHSTNIYGEEKNAEKREKIRDYVWEWCYDNHSEPKQLDIALDTLTSHLLNHFKVDKIVFIVDEYDAICNKAVLCLTNGSAENFEEVIEEIIGLCMNTIKILTKDHPAVYKSILTGISLVTTANLSDLNNVKCCRFQDVEEDSISKYYGLTKDELTLLLLKVNTDLRYEDIVAYYNGYRGEVLSIYSVEIALNRNHLDNYWANSGRILMVETILKNIHVRSILNHLLGDLSNSIEIKRMKKIECKHLVELRDILSGQDVRNEQLAILFNYLVEQGYFRIKESTAEDKLEIDVPNIEVKKELENQLFTYYESDYKWDLPKIKTCSKKFDQLEKFNFDVNKNVLNEICSLISEIMCDIEFTIKNEATIHHVFFAILHYARYKCFSEIRSSKSRRHRLDLLMVKDGFGIILELKLQPPGSGNNVKEIEWYADQGLQQILDKEYYDAFENDDFKPEDEKEKKIDYYVLIGVGVSQNQKVVFSALLNNQVFANKIMCR